jgi:hypothetical protein
VDTSVLPYGRDKARPYKCVIFIHIISWLIFILLLSILLVEMLGRA